MIYNHPIGSIYTTYIAIEQLQVAPICSSEALHRDAPIAATCRVWKLVFFGSRLVLFGTFGPGQMVEEVVFVLEGSGFYACGVGLWNVPLPK